MLGFLIKKGHAVVFIMNTPCERDCLPIQQNEKTSPFDVSAKFGLATTTKLARQ